MLPQDQRGAIRLFEVFGVRVFLHWTWFLLVTVQVQVRYQQYGVGVVQTLLELVAIFTVVLLHEFGHALACRSVGGTANRIVLWPLGGVAFVQPPARPGAWLWSIAAGPLVNVVLLPVTVVGFWAARQGEAGGWLPAQATDFVWVLMVINLVILCFNLLPIYPLDGGQMLHAVLWCRIGRAASLRWTAMIGLVAACVGGAAALWWGDSWLVLIAVFVGWQSWNGYRAALVLADREAAGFGDGW